MDFIAGLAKGDQFKDLFNAAFNFDQFKVILLLIFSSQGSINKFNLYFFLIFAGQT